MLTKIVGYIWLVMGILLLLKPQLFRDRLLKKGFKKMRMLLILFTLVLSGTLISIGFQYQGIIPKIFMIFGILGLIKAVLFLNSKASEKLLEWSASLPLTLFRIGACIHIAIAIIMIRL